MPTVVSVPTVDIKTGYDKEVTIKLEITLNINTTTGHVKAEVGPVSPDATPTGMKTPDFVIPKFEPTTELVDGFGT